MLESKLNYYLPRCQHPPPAPNYKNSLYEGRWYEMGRVSEEYLRLSQVSHNKVICYNLLTPVNTFEALSYIYVQLVSRFHCYCAETFWDR